MIRLWAACVLCCAVTSEGCDKAAGDDSPADALVAFLEALEEGVHDSSALARAYRLLDNDARQAVDARADKATSLAGRKYQPWEMLAEGRFRLRFTPARHAMRTKIDGDRATVTVTGSSGAQSFQVPMVRQDDGWRVVLELPPMYQPAASNALP